MGRAFGGGGKCKETPMQQMQKGQQGGGAAGAAAGGINPNIMIQVMAQQLFLQEQHKMKMRLGLQQAQQQVMANRQQVYNVFIGIAGAPLNNTSMWSSTERLCYIVTIKIVAMHCIKQTLCYLILYRSYACFFAYYAGQ
jgi:hypothetical protein